MGPAALATIVPNNLPQAAKLEGVKWQPRS
jgi:hypothetical protein